MPIYEYHCDKCGDFDVMQKITAKPLRKCPTCKSKVNKLISHTAFQLKGTGWYVTDYANKGKPSQSEESSSKSSEESSSESSGSDKKSESKSKSSKGKSKSPKGESAAA